MLSSRLQTCAEFFSAYDGFWDIYIKLVDIGGRGCGRNAGADGARVSGLDHAGGETVKRTLLQLSLPDGQGGAVSAGQALRDSRAPPAGGEGKADTGCCRCDDA